MDQEPEGRGERAGVGHRGSHFTRERRQATGTRAAAQVTIAVPKLP